MPDAIHIAVEEQVGLLRTLYLFYYFRKQNVLAMTFHFFGIKTWILLWLLFRYNLIARIYSKIGRNPVKVFCFNTTGDIKQNFHIEALVTQNSNSKSAIDFIRT